MVEEGSSINGSRLIGKGVDFNLSFLNCGSLESFKFLFVAFCQYHPSNFSKKKTTLKMIVCSIFLTLKEMGIHLWFPILETCSLLIRHHHPPCLVPWEHVMMVNMGPYHEFLEHVHLEAMYLLHNIQCHTNMTNKQKLVNFLRFCGKWRVTLQYSQIYIVLI